MDSEKILRGIFELVICEAKNNHEFSKKLNDILNIKNEENKKVKGIRRKKEKALVNPFDMLEKGQDEFENCLSKFSINQLKDIIFEYDLDPTKKTSKWKKEEKFMHHIIEMTTKRENKGNAFR